MAIKFGVQASQAGISWEELASQWKELDRNTSFDSLWLMDHFVTGMGEEQGSDGMCLEGWSALAALAAETSRVRIGILVSGNTYRHPAVLAKMATTVDHISGGRLDFGLGGAWHTYEHEAFGIPFHTVRERLERLDEAIQVIKLLWTEPSPKWKGRYYSLNRPPYKPRNVQQPHPPILIGGSGEKRTLRTVAKYADAANVSGTPEQIQHKFAVLEAHCKDVGRDYSTIRRTAQVMLFLSDNPAWQQRVVEGVAAARGLSKDDARRSVLLGSVDDVKAGVQSFVDAGVQEFTLAQFPSLHRKSLLRFSEEVVPAFR
jgi:F420-dependent oxidoreductase-like protein